MKYKKFVENIQIMLISDNLKKRKERSKKLFQ